MIRNILVHPIWRLYGDPSLPLSYSGDVNVLRMIATTMPDWYVHAYGRSEHAWKGDQVFYARMLLARRPMNGQTVMLEFLLRIDQLGAGNDLATVIASRQGANQGNIPWVLTPQAEERYGIGDEVVLVADLTLRVNDGEN